MRGELARLEHSPFGDDAGDEVGRCDVEGGIEHLDAFRSDRVTAMDRRDFERIALLDGNVHARLGVEIDRGVWRGHVEGDVVRPREDGDRVGADLIGDIAVRGNAIRADDAELNFTRKSVV